MATFIASGAGRLLSVASMVRNKESKSHFPIPLSSLRLRHCLDDPHFRFFLLAEEYSYKITCKLQVSKRTKESQDETSSNTPTGKRISIQTGSHDVGILDHSCCAGTTLSFLREIDHPHFEPTSLMPLVQPMLTRWPNSFAMVFVFCSSSFGDKRTRP